MDNTAKKKSEARKITVKFEGVCKACGTTIKPGQKATWYPGGTLYGESCHVSPFAKKTPQKKNSPPKAAPKQSNSNLDAKFDAILAVLNQHQSVLDALTKKLV